VCARYDSEYDNYRGGGGMTSDCESELNGGGEEGEGGSHVQQENIRQISQNITNKFGTHRSQR
jgi:hypothetical protein